MAETAQLLNDALREGKQILFEGAQGTPARYRPRHVSVRYQLFLLCWRALQRFGRRSHGHRPRARYSEGLRYPCWRRSLPPTELLYPENGGEGQDAIDGDTLCSEGHEFGVTTGRKRRCGWFDAVALPRYAAEVNGLTDIALTKLDVLSAFDELKICVAYECEGKALRTTSHAAECAVPCQADCIRPCLVGRVKDITSAKSFDELPQEAKDYVSEIERLSGVKASIISVGPDRKQTFMRGW